MVLTKIGKGKNAKYYLYTGTERKQITKSMYYKLSKILDKKIVKKLDILN